MAKENRIAIQFNTDDELQKQALEFLNKCGYKKNKIVAIMISEFLEKYGIDVNTMDASAAKEFISGYGYIKKHYNAQVKNAQQTMSVNQHVSEAVSETTHIIKEIPQNKVAKNHIQDDTVIDTEKADLALSAFGL